MLCEVSTNMLKQMDSQIGKKKKKKNLAMYLTQHTKYTWGWDLNGKWKIIIFINIKAKSMKFYNKTQKTFKVHIDFTSQITWSKYQILKIKLMIWASSKLEPLVFKRYH